MAKPPSERIVLIMAYVHIAHDCIIGDNVILVNSVALAGHVEVGNWAIISGLSAVHQFVKIGAHAMIGGGAMVRKDVPPFITAAGEPLAYAGVNSVGLKRRGFQHRRNPRDSRPLPHHLPKRTQHFPSC
jgi:UDP-N-acetylglucosamine acyltransferase